MKRRDFMAAMVGACATAPPPRARASARTIPSEHAEARLERISVSSSSFRDYFTATRDASDPSPGKELALLDFPRTVAERSRVHHLEFRAPHFGSTEPAYLQELKACLRRVDSFLVSISVDIEEIRRAGGFSDPDETVRNAAVEASKQWIDVAARLAAKSVCCDPGKMDAEHLERTADSYRKLVVYGRPKGIRILAGNHGGFASEHPEQLVRLFKMAGIDGLGALPDFGNFPDPVTRERGLNLLFPYAPTVCHATGRAFDAAGNETTFDFEKCIEISKRAKFRGIYSIQYSGNENAGDGVEKVANELLRDL